MVILRDSTSLTLTNYFYFQSPASYNHDPYVCKNSKAEVRRLKKSKVETNVRTDISEFIVFLAKAVGYKWKVFSGVCETTYVQYLTLRKLNKFGILLPQMLQK